MLGCVTTPHGPVSTRLQTVQGTSMLFLTSHAPHHIISHEPLVIDAFHQYAGPNRIVLDIGANVGAYSLLSAALGSTVYAVEMQPACCDIFRCHVHLNNRSAEHVHLLEGFVPRMPSQAPILVPPDKCNVMASASATGGRWPNGLLMKSHRLMNWSATVRIPPVDLQRSLSHVDSVALTKIDTEGSEIECLMALNWTKLQAVIIEFQAGAWKYNNISRAYGTEVVRGFARHRSYTIHSLFGKTSRVWSTDELIRFLMRQTHSFKEFLFVT
jgi:FkbM family methyltransferase